LHLIEERRAALRPIASSRSARRGVLSLAPLIEPITSSRPSTVVPMQHQNALLARFEACFEVAACALNQTSCAVGRGEAPAQTDLERLYLDWMSW
jgi:hypothetical protein